MELEAALGGGPPAGEASGRCPWCDGENLPGARFCQFCGERLSGREPDFRPQSDDRSRTVTAVACELSTDWPATPGASVPPEALVRVREILERHGGEPRELAGVPGTVGAVFGPEPAGGDGPLRALRAADEIRSRFGATGEPAVGAGAGGVPAAASIRIGVGASDLGGDGPDAERLWSERVLDLAVRLQRMAGPGEVIVSESVYRSVGDAAELRPVDPRAPAEGDASVGPLRLLSVTPGPTRLGLARPPLIGREREIALLREAFDRTVAARRGSLIRVIGDPGVGKTRLIEELLGDLEREGAARTVVVRCRPAAEGGLTWPLAELVAAAIGLEPGEDPERARARIEGLLPGDPDAGRVAERLLPALGLPGRGAAAETGWALRRLLEGAAAGRPLVVAVDDAERAGSAFGRLLEDVVRRVRAAPVLVVVVGWGEEEAEAAGTGSTVRLEPLPDRALGELVSGVLGDRALSSEIRDALVAPCAGNPLIAEQYVAMLVDHGYLGLDLGRWVATAPPSELPVPESFDALLELRLAELGGPERALIGVAAAIGERVDLGCLGDIVADRSPEELRDQVESLVGVRLVRLEDGRALVFVHPLVRAAARELVPAELRAELHERCARWLETSDVPLHERSPEVIGAHLEVAATAGAGAPARAAELLSRAAEGVETLGNLRGALALRLRAAALVPEEDRRLADLLVHAGRLHAALGEVRAADGILAHAGRIALTHADRAREHRAKLLRAALRLDAPDPDALERVREVADATIEECAELGDDLGLAWAWSARGAVYRSRGHWSAAADATARAAEHAAAAGRRDEELRALQELARAVAHGRLPVVESVQRCEEVLERVRGERPAEQVVRAILAELLARAGRIDSAREHATEAVAALEELDMEAAQATCLLALGRVEALSGRSDEAERALRRAIELAEEDRATRLRCTASLAHLLLDAGREPEALELVDEAEPAASDDVPVRVEWEAARARALAAAGRYGEANALARRAVTLADQTDLVELRARALLDLADVLRISGRPNEATPFAHRALRALERKGATGEVAVARAVLERIDRPRAEAVPSASIPAEAVPSASIPAEAVPGEPAAGPDAEAGTFEPAPTVADAAMPEIRDPDPRLGSGPTDQSGEAANDGADPLDSAELPPTPDLPPSQRAATPHDEQAEQESHAPGRRFRWRW